MLIQPAYAPLQLDFLKSWWSAHSQCNTALAIQYTASSPSTNGQLLRAKQRHNTLLVAEQQVQGRGQFDRPWQSMAGDLTFSLGLVLPSASVSGLSLRAGLALHEVCAAHNLTTRLKWANDVIATHPYTGLQGKLAGILIETAPMPNSEQLWVVIGMGINGAPRLLPQQHNHLTSTAYPPIGLAQLSEAWQGDATLASAQVRAGFLLQVIDTLLVALHTDAALPNEAFAARWNACDIWADHVVRMTEPDGQVCTGRAAGINAHGAYTLQTTDGLREFMSGQLRAAEIAP